MNKIILNLIKAQYYERQLGNVILIAPKPGILAFHIRISNLNICDWNLIVISNNIHYLITFAVHRIFSLEAQ